MSGFLCLFSFYAFYFTFIIIFLFVSPKSFLLLWKKFGCRLFRSASLPRVFEGSCDCRGTTPRASRRCPSSPAPGSFPEAASVVLVTSAGAPRGAGKATLPLFTRLSYLKGLGFPFVGRFSFPRFVELAPKSPSPNGRHPWFCSEPFDLHPLPA